MAHNYFFNTLRGFWDWMYPVHGGEESVSEAALGVIILWFCWYVGMVTTMHNYISLLSLSLALSLSCIPIQVCLQLWLS